MRNILYFIFGTGSIWKHILYASNTPCSKKIGSKKIGARSTFISNRQEIVLKLT